MKQIQYQGKTYRLVKFGENARIAIADFLYKGVWKPVKSHEMAYILYDLFKKAKKCISPVNVKAHCREGCKVKVKSYGRRCPKK